MYLFISRVSDVERMDPTIFPDDDHTAQDEVKEKEPEQSLALHTTVISSKRLFKWRSPTNAPMPGSSSSSRYFDFDWADDVNEAFGDVCISPHQAETPPKYGSLSPSPNLIDVSSRNGEYLIEGNRYRYAQGASRKVPVFSVQTADRRYEYEDSVSTLGSPPVSPETESPKQVNNIDKPVMPVAQTTVQKQVWGKKSGKSRARVKKHNLPTPAVRPAYE